MATKSSTATLRPTIYGKRVMARQLYQKGRHFIGAALLLRDREGDEYVVLHLLCQGIEIIVKALLLLRNFAKYQPILQTKYGHKLMRLASDALVEFKLNPLQAALSTELRELDRMYAKHILRYSLLATVFIDPKTIPSRLVLRRAAAVLRLADRELARKGDG